MGWDTELVKLKSEASLRREQRLRSSPQSGSEMMTPQIKMIVSQWYTDEFGNRARMIYNAKNPDFEAPYGLPRGFSPA